jgi:hypothetical protein
VGAFSKEGIMEPGVRGARAVVVALMMIPPLDADQITCNIVSQEGATQRLEALADQVRAMAFRCTGGDRTPSGQQVPRVSIRVQLNTNVGNVLLPNGGPDAFVIIDNPAPPNQVVQPHTEEASLTGVGGDGISYELPGSPVNLGQRVPNVYQGRMRGRNEIVWLGVPFEAPGTTATRIIRIRNVRADANNLARSNVNSVTATVNSPELGIDNAIFTSGIANTLAYLGDEFPLMGMHFTQVGHPTPPRVVVQRGRLRRFS